MPRAKPPYDGDMIWKHREYDEAQWRELNSQVQKSLRPLYPDQTAIADPPFEHPADEWAFEHPADTWATELLDVAHGEITRAQWLGRRRTNEELRAEQKDILKILEKAKKRLGSLSHDLAMMLDQDADVLGCRDEIAKLIPFIEGTASKIGLTRARRRQDVEHQAAVRMAHYILPMLSTAGIPPSATANTDLDNFSNAVEILKIIGDALGLKLAKATWKGVITKAKRSISSGHWIEAPKKGGLRTPRIGRQ